MYDKEDNLFKIQHVHNYHIVIIEKQSRTEQEYSRQEQVTKLPDVIKSPLMLSGQMNQKHQARQYPSEVTVTIKGGTNNYTCWHFNKQTWYGQVVDICTIFPSVPSIL